MTATENDRDILDIELNAPEAAEFRLDLGPGPERCNLQKVVNASACIRRLVGIQRPPHIVCDLVASGCPRIARGVGGVE